MLNEQKKPSIRRSLVVIKIKQKEIGEKSKRRKNEVKKSEGNTFK